MHRFSTIICLLLITTTLTYADGKKEVRFPNTAPGLQIYRYNWDVETCVLYVAEMSRHEPTLHFEVALANAQVLGKESVRAMANRRTQRGDRRVLVAVNGGFGVLGDMRGYGGVLENLHIQDGELITQPTDTEACFGVTESGEFLSSSVQMNANLQIGTHTLQLGCINQRRLDGCQVTLYTPRLGESTRTNRRRGREVILSGLPLPLTPSYEHPYRVETVSRDGHSLIPRDGAVLWINARLKDESISHFNTGADGTLTISLSPPEWNHVPTRHRRTTPTPQKWKNKSRRSWRCTTPKNDIPRANAPVLNLSHEPRTALGYNADTLFLVVADGRQPKYSTGLTLYELASILIETRRNGGNQS